MENTGQKAKSRFRSALRAWLAGVSVVAVAAFAPVSAKASTQHQKTHGSHTTHTVSTHKATTHKVTRTMHSKHVEHHVATRHVTHKTHTVSRTTRHYASSSHAHYSRVAEFRHSRLQCVPYAREVSHIDLSGNAFLWWAEAAGRYARGDTPAVGAVLNFRSIRRMPLGHVAVVTAVLDSRTILVTQANWVPGTITNDVTVQDVSADNDWSAVQVELGDTSTMGSTYPTYGFIYNHQDTGTVIASNGGRNEVAEAPVARPVAAEAPNRNLQ